MYTSQAVCSSSVYYNYKQVRTQENRKPKNEKLPGPYMQATPIVPPKLLLEYCGFAWAELSTRTSGYTPNTIVTVIGSLGGVLSDAHFSRAATCAVRM